jgi:TonB family protein
MKRVLSIAGLTLVLANWAAALDGAKPHGLGLLTGRASLPEAVERLRAGLKDASPETRAAAVRVINASGVSELVPAVQEALATESDPLPGGEMVRLLAVLGRPELDAAVLEAAQRLGPGVHLELADGLGRRGVAALPHLPALRALGARDGVVQSFYRVATREGAIGPAAAPVLRDGAAGAWSLLLENARRTRTPVDAGLLIAGVRSESPAMRVATYWHLALDRRAGPPTQALLDALDAAPEASAGPSVDLPAGASHEAARRALGRPPRGSLLSPGAAPPELVAAMPTAHDMLVRLYDLATDKERGVLLKDVPDRKAIERMAKEERARALLPRAADQSPMRTVSGFPRGFVEDVLAATGCVLEESDGIRGGEVSYGADGRPRTVPAFAGAKGCDEMARVLVTSALAPLGVPSAAGERILLMVPARKAFLTSMARGVPEVAVAAPGPLVAPAVHSIKEPKKILNVNPIYPDAAREARIQGAVILEAWISDTGDIYTIRLLQSVDRSLDLAAVGAVAGWKYLPTEVGGVPVPVLMTVTVNFKLR